MYREKSCFIYDNDLSDYYACLGEKGRREFLDWLTTYSLPSDERNKGINYDYSTDYRDDVRRTGRCIVYLYTNELGVPFYVGKGREDRALNVAARSDAFKEALDQNGICRIFAIVSNIFDKNALDVETLVITELLNRGWRLTNSMKTTISNEKYESLKEDYPNVLNTINDITRTGLMSLLDDKDNFGQNGKVAKHGKTFVKAI